MKKAELQDNAIQITFPYHPLTVEQVKTLKGRVWDKDNKRWLAHLNETNLIKLKEWGFLFDDSLINFSNQKQESQIEIPKTKNPLYSFQQQGVYLIEKFHGRVLLSDEMGCGKTCQSLLWLYAHPELRPIIIITPSSLKYKWEEEAHLWNPISEEYENIFILNGTKTHSIPSSTDMIIVNYDILFAWVESLRKLNSKVVVMDECHYIKSSSTKRTKAVKKLCKGVPHIIAISGTPIVNRPVEFFNVLNITSPLLFPSFWKFAMRYCNAKKTPFGWDFSGASHIEELHATLTNNLMIRRLKKDVLADLPPKIRSVIPVEITNKEEYDYARDNFLDWVRENNPEKLDAAKRGAGLVMVKRLQQLAMKGKQKSYLTWVKEFLEEQEKLVVFAIEQKQVNLLMQEFKKYYPVKVDGSVKSQDRAIAENTFQTDPKCRLFVGNIEAAGVGLTLTAASAVCFIELDWVPGNHTQAEDRIHRIGQTKGAMIYYLVAKDTIEERIMAIIDKKQRILSETMDGKEVKDEDLLTELMKEKEFKFFT